MLPVPHTTQPERLASVALGRCVPSEGNEAQRSVALPPAHRRLATAATTATVATATFPATAHAPVVILPHNILAATRPKRRIRRQRLPRGREAQALPRYPERWRLRIGWPRGRHGAVARCFAVPRGRRGRVGGVHGQKLVRQRPVLLAAQRARPPAERSDPL